MTTESLKAKIQQYNTIDAAAVADAIAFLDHGKRGASVSESIEAFANLDRAAYHELVRRWNATAPVYAADTFAR